MSFEDFKKTISELPTDMDDLIDNNEDEFVELVPNMSRKWYYKPACTILVIIYLLLLIGTFGYAFIQFEFCSQLRPEFIDSWIKSLDKATLPLIFHENQKHPIVLFGLWITSIFWGLKAIASLEKLSSPFFFLVKMQEILSANKKQIILGIAFLFIMSKPYVYKVAIAYFIIEFLLFYAQNKD